MATQPNCWKFLRVFATTSFWKQIEGTRLIAEPNGNNVKNWIISSHVPNLAMVKSMGKVQRLDDCGSQMTV